MIHTRNKTTQKSRAEYLPDSKKLFRFQSPSPHICQNISISSIKSPRRRFLVPIREEVLQGVVHLSLLPDDVVAKLGIPDVAVGAHQGGMAAVLVHFGVAEEVGALDQFLDESDAAFIVRDKVVAVGEMEGIDVVTVGRIAAVDHRQGETVGGGAHGSPAF